MKTLTGLLRLTRPANMLICFLTVICGGILGGSPLQRFGMLASSAFSGIAGLTAWEWKVLAAALSASLILAAGNAFNDACDVATDRINAPHRPIPSGTVSQRSAKVFAVMLAIAGLILSTILGAVGTGLAFCAVLLLFVYDLYLKGVPLAGNAAVALLGGAAFVYGGIAGDAFARSLLPATYAALFHFGRELIKDAADFEGDNAAGIATAATVWGISAACWVSTLTFAALGAVVTLPWLAGSFGSGYAVIVATGVLPVLACAAILPFFSRSALTLRRIAVILKVDMPVGLIAVLAGFQGM